MHASKSAVADVAVPDDFADFFDLETREDLPPDLDLGLTTYGLGAVAGRLGLDSRFLRLYLPFGLGSPAPEDAPDACMSPEPPTGIAWEAPVPAPSDAPSNTPCCGM